MAESTPRITAPYLQQFQHHTVRLLGKVTQLRGDEATIDAGGSVTLQLNRVRQSRSMNRDILTYQDAHLTLDHAVEVIGKVDKDLTVRVLVSTDFGTSIGTLQRPAAANI